MTEEDLRKQAWDYFQLHAAQRLTTFNFYVGVSSLLVGGLAATIKGDLEVPLLVGVIGVLLIVFSFVFWKLDQRNSDLIKGAERTLMYFEGRSGLPEQNGKPHEAKRFTREDFETKQKKLERTWRVWRNQYSYSDCFRALFLIFGGLGAVGLAHAALFGALTARGAPRGNEPAQPATQEREAASALSKRQAYELSERCGKTSGEEFRREWKQGIVNTKTGQMAASFTNHYNSRLNKCFYLLRVTHFTHKKSAADETTMNISMNLFDINESKDFGSYFGAPTSAAKPVAGPSYNCNVLDKRCSSEAEWEALAKPYMED